MEIEFEVPGAPRGKGRPRFTRQGVTYTPKETTAYEKEVKAAFYKARSEYAARTGHELKLIQGQVALVIVAYFEIPKSCTKKARDRIMAEEDLPMKKPDVDNIAKIIGDALNGVAYRDDKQVIALFAAKVYDTDGRGPRVSVKIIS